MLGTERSRLTDRRFQLFVAPSSRPAFNAFLEQIFAGHEKQVCEVSLLNGGRAAFWADLQAMSAVTFGGARKWCRVAVIDVAARKQAEAAQSRIDHPGRHEPAVGGGNRPAAGRGDGPQEKRATRPAIWNNRANAAEKDAPFLPSDSAGAGKPAKADQPRVARRHQPAPGGHQRPSGRLRQGGGDQPAGIPRNIAPIRRLVEKSLRIVHRFARELRPASLDDLGLIPALRSYIEDFPKQKGRQIQFTAFAGVEALDNDKRTVLYRVAQEALTNVAKHAHARVVKVTILKIPGGVCLEVTDDGKAFDVGRLSSAEWSNHLGLHGMRERVEMVGGRFSVVSASGRARPSGPRYPWAKRPCAHSAPLPWWWATNSSGG
jgi:hypothetical protein